MDIVHLEQHVNSRYGTDPPPSLPPDMLPEKGAWHPMAWVEIPTADVSVVCDDPATAPKWCQLLEGAPGNMRFPIHPIIEPRYRGSQIVRSGKFTASASYRTVFFEPDVDTALSQEVPSGYIMMIKLHLDEPLPGIPGDRRLTPDKIRKCIQLSAELPAMFAASHQVHRLSVLRERVEIIQGDRGAIIRLVPREQVFPLFALFSMDETRPSDPPMLIRELETRRIGAREVAETFGNMVAEPLLRAVLAGFDLGVSLELHAQNTLGVSSPQKLVESVFFRDLESVQFFPRLRAARGYAKVGLDIMNPELVPRPATPRRWFSRNVDHDVGRILRGALTMLRFQGVLSKEQNRAAVRSCQRTYRSLVDEFDLGGLDGLGRLMPLARAPYGRFWNRGGYYRTEFR